MSRIELHGYLRDAPSIVRKTALMIIITLTVGYSVGMRYLYITSDLQQSGIQENYLGNENEFDVQVMKFKMPEAKLLTIIHSHVISYAFIFSLLAAFLLLSSIPHRLKNFLILEPFVMVIVNFGLLYLLWCGHLWTSPLIMISGIILTAGFYLTVFLLIKDIIMRKK